MELAFSVVFYVPYLPNQGKYLIGDVFCLCSLLPSVLPTVTVIHLLRWSHGAASGDTGLLQKPSIFRNQIQVVYILDVYI